MEPLYSETYLHANAPAKRKIIRGLLIVLMAFLLFIGLFSMLFLRTVIPFGVIILVDVTIYFVMPTTQRVLELITTKYNVMDILGSSRADIYMELERDLSAEFAKYGIDTETFNIENNYI